MLISFTTLDYGDEAASLAAVASGQAPSSEDHVYGTVVLQRTDGACISIKDDLLFLAPDLCAAAPALLERDGAATVTLVDTPNAWRLVRRGEEVDLSDLRGASIVLPYKDLLPALRDCGRRFAAFIDALGSVQGGFEWAAAGIHAALEQRPNRPDSQTAGKLGLNLCN